MAALAQPWVDTVLSGAASVRQVESNPAAARVTFERDDMAAPAGVAEPVSAYGDRRAALPWN